MGTCCLKSKRKSETYRNVELTSLEHEISKNIHDFQLKGDKNETLDNDQDKEEFMFSEDEQNPSSPLKQNENENIDFIAEYRADRDMLEKRQMKNIH